MTILIVQMTQISNMKVIGLMVDFKKNCTALYGDVWRWSGGLGKYQSRKRYLLWYAKVPYVT